MSGLDGAVRGWAHLPGLVAREKVDALRGVVLRACARHGGDLTAVRCEVMVDPAVRAIREDGALLAAVEGALGGKAVSLGADVLRVVQPGEEPTGPHRDSEYLAQRGFWIAWVALEDCPLEKGPLVVHAAEATVVPVAAGDVILISAETVHSALENRSAGARLSVDFRYGR